MDGTIVAGPELKKRYSEEFEEVPSLGPKNQSTRPIVGFSFQREVGLRHKPPLTEIVWLMKSVCSHPQFSQSLGSLNCNRLFEVCACEDAAGDWDGNDPCVWRIGDYGKFDDCWGKSKPLPVKFGIPARSENGWPKASQLFSTRACMKIEIKDMTSAEPSICRLYKQFSQRKGCDPLW